jgi:hypothetical protein
MPTCDPQSFTGITQARFDCLKQKAAAAGIAINADSGEANRDGIIVRWQFDPGAQTLELQCMGHPFFLNCSLVNSQLQALVAGCS